jgi:hypothetical protein
MRLRKAPFGVHHSDAPYNEWESSMSDLRNDDQFASHVSGVPSQGGVHGALGSAKDAAREVADAAGGQATSLIAQARDQATSVLTDQKDGIADRIDQLADTVHGSSVQFEGKQDWIASAIDRGATELGSLASALRENDIACLFQQAQSIARRQPALFIGASLAAGFAVARLGKLVVADTSQDDLPTLSGDNHAQA